MGLGRGCTSWPRCGCRLSVGRRASTWRNLRAPSEGFGSGLGACRGEETIRAFVGRLIQKNMRLCSWVPWLLWEARLKLRQENPSRACLSEVFKNTNACGSLGLHFSTVLERQGKSLPLFGLTSAVLVMQKSKQRFPARDPQDELGTTVPGPLQFLSFASEYFCHLTVNIFKSKIVIE